MYHIVANIDSNFPSAEAALAAYSGVEFKPKVPKTTAPNEDHTTPRICVAQDIKDCITAIGLLGRFRRCLAANEDAKSYETLGIEVYPILILHFADDLDYYTPDKSQVPDVDVASERWLLKPTTPDFVRIAWMHPRSIIWEYREGCGRNEMPQYICKSVSLKFATAGPEGRIHPWLTGTGNILESSKMEEYHE